MPHINNTEVMYYVYFQHNKMPKSLFRPTDGSTKHTKTIIVESYVEFDNIYWKERRFLTIFPLLTLLSLESALRLPCSLKCH